MTVEITFVLKEEDMALVHRNLESRGHSSVREYLRDAMCRGSIADAEFIKMMIDSQDEITQLMTRRILHEQS